MDKINVESIASLSQLGTEAVRAVVIHLNLHIGPLAQLTLPPSENVAAGYILRCVHIDRGRRRIKRKILSLPEFPRVRISLNRECVIFVIVPIHPKAGLTQLHVIKVACVRVKLRPAAKTHAIHTIVEVVADACAEAESARALIYIAAAYGNERSAAFFGIVRDDVDDSVDGVRSPDGAAGSTNDLDPIDIFEQNILQSPINAGKKRCVHVASINEHQN